MHTVRLTMAQAIIRFLMSQFVERDGQEHAFFAGCFGIFGHGNVAGIGQALQIDHEEPRLLRAGEIAPGNRPRVGGDDLVALFGQLCAKQRAPGPCRRDQHDVGRVHAHGRACESTPRGRTIDV